MLEHADGLHSGCNRLLATADCSNPVGSPAYAIRAAGFHGTHFGTCNGCVSRSGLPAGSGLPSHACGNAAGRRKSPVDVHFRLLCCSYICGVAGRLMGEWRIETACECILHLLQDIQLAKWAVSPGATPLRRHGSFPLGPLYVSARSID